MNRNPDEAWQTLFAHALELVDSVSAIMNREFVDWTLGGGTVLMLRYRHRLSRDVDIFLPDPQYLSYFAPRVNDVAASKTSVYEEKGDSLRFYFKEGEVDFIAAPALMREAYESARLLDRPVRLETSAEIVVKKIWYRGAALKARDLFDIALIVDREVKHLEAATTFLLERRDVILRRLEHNETQLRADFGQLNVLDYQPSYDQCVANIRRFFQSLAQSTYPLPSDGGATPKPE